MEVADPWRREGNKKATILGQNGSFFIQSVVEELTVPGLEKPLLRKSLAFCALHLETLYFKTWHPQAQPECFETGRPISRDKY